MLEEQRLNPIEPRRRRSRLPRQRRSPLANAFFNHESYDVGALCSQRDANAQLVHSLRDHVGDDAVHSNRRDDERQRTERDERCCASSKVVFG